MTWLSQNVSRKTEGQGTNLVDLHVLTLVECSDLCMPSRTATEAPLFLPWFQEYLPLSLSIADA